MNTAVRWVGPGAGSGVYTTSPDGAGGVTSGQFSPVSLPPHGQVGGDSTYATGTGLSDYLGAIKGDFGNSSVWI